MAQSHALTYNANLARIAANYELIKAKTLILYLYGEVQYFDGSGRTHTTQYCFFLANPRTKELDYCEGFNELN